MDEQQLVNLLEKAVPDIQTPSIAGETEATGRGHSRSFCDKGTSGEAWHRLSSFIRDCAELEVFDNSMLNTGDGGGTQVTHETLAKWLLYTAKEAGPTEAVKRLQRFLELDATPGCHILALYGLRVSRPVKISDSIDLVPFEDIPDSDAKRSFESIILAQEFQPPELPHAALIRAIRISPKTFAGAEIPRPVPGIGETLHQALDFLTVVGPCAPKPVAEWTWFENWVPCASHALLGRIFHSPSLESMRNSAPYVFSDSDCSEAVQIISKCSTLKPRTKQALRIPLQRLNQSIGRQSLVDKIIDLSIALEAVLLQDNQDVQQLSLSFRLRGAWLIGTSAHDRKNYADLLKHIYRYRSKAVHTGRVDDEVVTRRNGNKETVSQLVQEGIVFCARILRVIIEQGGMPDWNNLILGDSAYRVN